MNKKSIMDEKNYSRIRSFKPVIDKNTKILILGSVPGPDSLRKGEYYGHHRNHFWKIMGRIISEPLVNMSYSSRLKVLLDHSIGLWDVFKSCYREGSSDSRIKRYEINNIPGLLKRNPGIKLVVFNGKKASNVFKDLPVESIVMPSTSPANTSKDKIKRWMIIKDYL